MPSIRCYNPAMPEFIVKHACILKDFLSQSLQISGTKAKQLLDARKVFVNGQRVWVAGYKLKAGDMVEVNQVVPEALEGTGTSTLFDIRHLIIAEDNDYLIVNKPAGIIVNEHKHSLENKLKHELKNTQLQAAHRLDKDTSGLVIFAKNPQAFNKIVQVFKNFGVEKNYRCLVQGNILKKFPREFTLKQPIAGQSAETKVHILKTNDLASYLEIQLVTGRKHQIRLHLSAAGFPLLGEQNYQTKALNNPLFRQVPRQMLHAASIKFTDPISSKVLQTSVKEPPDFLDTLKLFKLC